MIPTQQSTLKFWFCQCLSCCLEQSSTSLPVLHLDQTSGMGSGDAAGRSQPYVPLWVFLPFHEASSSDLLDLCALHHPGWRRSDLLKLTWQYKGEMFFEILFKGRVPSSGSLNFYFSLSGKLAPRDVNSEVLTDWGPDSSNWDPWEVAPLISFIPFNWHVVFFPLRPFQSSASDLWEISRKCLFTFAFDLLTAIKVFINHWLLHRYV